MDFCPTLNHYMHLALLEKDTTTSFPNQSPKDPGKAMKQNSTPHCHIDHMFLRGLLFRTQDFVNWQSVVKENRTNSEPSINLTLMHLGNCGRNSPWNKTTYQTVRYGQVLSGQIATCRLLSNHVAPRDSATLRSCSQNVPCSSSQAPNKVASWLSTNTSMRW